MSDAKTPAVFVDTSSWRNAGFDKDPDFEKLLQRAREGNLRLVVSRIAWDEWCAHQRGSWRKQRDRVESRFNSLSGRFSGHPIAGLLPRPDLVIWDREDLDIAIDESMAEYVHTNKIEIHGFQADHAERVWSRYIELRPPFTDKENRREHIPDCWILEAAIDLHATLEDPLIALCSDRDLCAALEGEGIRVFQKPSQVVRGLNREPSIPIREVVEAQARAQLDAELARAAEQLEGLGRRILGHVAYLDSPSKAQLTELWSYLDIAPSDAANVAGRLVAAGLLEDTGNHYLVPTPAIAEIAAQAVEGEIIEFLRRT